MTTLDHQSTTNLRPGQDGAHDAFLLLPEPDPHVMRDIAGPEDQHAFVAQRRQRLPRRQMQRGSRDGRPPRPARQ